MAAQWMSMAEQRADMELNRNERFAKDNFAKLFRKKYNALYGEERLQITVTSSKMNSQLSNTFSSPFAIEPHGEKALTFMLGFYAKKRQAVLQSDLWFLRIPQ